MNDYDKLNWLTPWEPADERDRQRLESELRSELAPGHVLFGRKFRAVAGRRDQDDVLYELVDPLQFAVVHLSYPRTKPDKPPWPATELFDSLASFVANRMQPDNSDYTRSG